MTRTDLVDLQRVTADAVETSRELWRLALQLDVQKEALTPVLRKIIRVQADLELATAITGGEHACIGVSGMVGEAAGTAEAAGAAPPGSRLRVTRSTGGFLRLVGGGMARAARGGDGASSSSAEERY